MNHNDKPVTMSLVRLPACRELLTDKPASRRYVVAGGDVAVLNWTA